MMEIGEEFVVFGLEWMNVGFDWWFYVWNGDWR